MRKRLLKGLVVWLSLTIAVLTATLPCSGQAVDLGVYAMSSNHLDMWVEVYYQNSWHGLGRTLYNALSDWLPNPEVQLLLGEGYISDAFITFLYRLHPYPELDYRIGLRNKSQHPLGVVLSIDGSNTLDASRQVVGDSRDQIWVLPETNPAYYYIDGWRLNSQLASKFRFSAAMPGPGQNPGQIRADVYFPSGTATELGTPIAVLGPNPGTVACAGAFLSYFDSNGQADIGGIVTSFGPLVPSPTSPAQFTWLTAHPIEQILVSYSSNVEAFLGVVLRTVGTIGAEVLYVIPGSAAYNAGIQPGQIITFIDNILITSAPQVTGIITSRSPGQTVTVWLSDSQRVTSATLLIPLGRW